MNTAGDSLLGKIQDKLKHIGWLYYGLVKIFKPVWENKEIEENLRDSLERHPVGSFILNIGSGPSMRKDRPDIINVDLFAFNEVDLVADATDFPLKDGSADLILNQAMLEHVPYPEKVVEEMYRLLKSGGETFCYLPFISPFHAAPHDYNRWTIPGVKHLFRKFDHIHVGIGTGPTSGMLWVVQEWLAIFFSFGSRWCHDIIFLILMVLTSPIKVLDKFMVRLPYAEKVAGGFYVIAKKNIDA